MGEPEGIDDEYYPRVKAWIGLGGQPVVATVQRVFKIGYNRSCWLFERMVSEGVLEKSGEFSYRLPPKG